MIAMTPGIRMRSATVVGVCAAVVATTPLAAQQANASAAAFGMGGAYTAMARNDDAVAWNPAALGLKETRKFSLALVGGGYSMGVRPVTLADIKSFSGQTIPVATRQQWLDAVRSDATEQGGGEMGVNWLSMNIGRVGLQASTTMTGSAKLNGDAFEAIFFGNAGRTGSVSPLNFAGSSFRMAALSTFAGSLGIPFGGGDGVEQAIGVTGKMVMGHFLALAQDNGSSVTANNVAVQFPIVHTSSDKAGTGGSGFGVDLGYVRKSGGTTLAATVRNLVNTFAWDAGAMVSRAGTASFDGNTSTSAFDEVAYSNAPAAMKQAVSNYQLKPTVAFGLAHVLKPDLTLSADVQQQLGDETTLLTGPRTQVGAGVEYRGLSALPLRAGVTYITDGFALSGGVGLRLGSAELGVSMRYRSLNGAGDVGLMVNVLAIH